MSVTRSVRLASRAVPMTMVARRFYQLSNERAFSNTRCQYAPDTGRSTAAQTLQSLSEELEESSARYDMLDVDSQSSITIHDQGHRATIDSQDATRRGPPIRQRPQREQKYKSRPSIGYEPKPTSIPGRAAELKTSTPEPLIENAQSPQPWYSENRKAPQTQPLEVQTSSSLPWYLQNQQSPSPRVALEQVNERQRIPPLPEHAPPLLEPLLNYISTDLGLDYLTLMDLRSLDPPAALGANLIMIVASARGEKHLHVSADRCCRWLRSNHKLRPLADGLLGRQELKVKMRRRTKRLKIMASAGATEHGEADDGIRTGWVCVNISDVEPASMPEGKKEQAVAYPQGFVGFGESPDSVKIVVQMLTEEMRDDLDIETLWENRVKKQEKLMGAPNSHGAELNYPQAPEYFMPAEGTPEALIG